MDEDAVHDSFSQLIAEHSRNGAPSEALELQQLQRELTEESQGIAVPSQGWKLKLKPRSVAVGDPEDENCLFIVAPLMF